MARGGGPTIVRTKPRLGSLDGLRGVAALLVMLLHAANLLGLELFGRAYLMVDLFFLISGYVLAAAYGERLATPREGLLFARNRLVRLYPMAVFSLLVGAAVSLLVAAQAGQPAHSPFFLTLALSAAFLPVLGGGLLVPFNAPLWSLQAELWTNFAYAAVAPRLTTRRLILLAAAMGLVLAAAALLNGGLNAGFANNDAGRGAGPWSFAMAWARIGFSFPLGLLLHRLSREGRLRAKPTQTPTLFILVVLLAVATLPVQAWAGLDLMIVMVIFPALVIVVADSTPTGRVAQLATGLGRMSYALYVLHGPILMLINKLTPAGTSAPAWVALIGLGCIGAIAAAALAERCIDRPIRAWAARRSQAAYPAGFGDRVLAG